MKRLKDESGQASVITALFDRFFQRLRRNQGQALIEYLLVLPMVFLLLVNVVNFGGFFYAFITVANAARAGLRIATPPVVPTGPPPR